jgi:hypothetical protein
MLMAEKEIIQMITDKLDRLEDKVDSVKDKLNEFELSAQNILTTHDLEIKNQAKEIEILKTKIVSSEKVSAGQNWISKVFSDSVLSTWIFRFLLILFLTLFGMKKETISTVFDLAGSSKTTHIDTIRIPAK